MRVVAKFCHITSGPLLTHVQQAKNFRDARLDFQLNRAPTRRALRLLNEPDRHRVAVEFSFAHLDGGDDDEDGVENPEDREEDEADQDEAKDGGDEVVDEHRDLEVERFLAVGVDLG